MLVVETVNLFLPYVFCSHPHVKRVQRQGLLLKRFRCQCPPPDLAHALAVLERLVVQGEEYLLQDVNDVSLEELVEVAAPSRLRITEFFNLFDTWEIGSVLECPT